MRTEIGKLSPYLFPHLPTRPPESPALTTSVAETIGFVAAATSTLCWFPQSIRTIRTRDTSGISRVSQGAYTGAILLWAVYGVMIGSWPLILSNVIQLFPLTAVLWIKVANERAARRTAP